ncbi:putative glycosyltransferase, partial [Gregarina niphandrodes]
LILVQNPPTVFVLWLLLIHKLLYRSKLVVDCHNYGYTIAACSGWALWAVRLLEFLEIGGMKWCDSILTVSEAMSGDLHGRVGFAMPISCCYDRPVADNIAKVSRERAREVLLRYVTNHPATKASGICHNLEGVTWLAAAAVAFRENVHIVVCSTSYTPDESIDWVVEASSEAAEAGRRVLLVITGKGAGRGPIEQLSSRLTTLNPYLSVAQLFVDYADYHSVLRAADLGVSSHRSSSGLDLPMKVVDMFTAGIPVLSYYYPTVGEQIDFKHTYQTKRELVQLLKQRLDARTLDTAHTLDAAHPSTARDTRTWEEEWRAKVHCVFDELLS